MQMSLMFQMSLRIIVVLGAMVGSGCAIDRNDRRADRVDSTVLTENIFGIWVTRWDFQSAEDIRSIVSNSKAAGVTDLYWQVRGQGDAYYRSALEPWGEEITQRRGADGKPINDRKRALDPGFDPLWVAINEAHEQGIRVHAWVNVMPLWRGKEPPIDPKHSFYTRDHWRLSDENSKAQPLGDGYVVVNPVLDEVQDHIVRVVRDIVTRYDIDGVHLDYIRFLSDELDKDKLYPGDAKSLSLYARMVGDRATAGQINRSKYRDWIRDRITNLVDRIGRESLDGYPDIRYSAAVWRRPELAKDLYLQDAQKWVGDGMIDEIIPMIYTDSDSQFQNDLESWYQSVDRKRVIAGIGTYKHMSGGQTLSQITLGHPKRFVLFAYSSIFESVNPDQDKKPEAVKERALKRDSISQFIKRIGG